MRADRRGGGAPRRRRSGPISAGLFAGLLLAGLAGRARAVDSRVASGAGSPAGRIAFRRLAIPDDVPAHLATALAEDRQGFLWIGTQDGLVRFDGSRFKVFRPDPADPGTLGGSYVRALLAGADGRLWVGTMSGGLSVYDPASERFRRYRHDPRDPASLSDDRVEALAEDRAGRLWIATYEGLDRLDPPVGREPGRRVHFRHDPADPRSLADDRVRALLVDRAGRLWAGGRDGLQVYLGDGKGFARVASDPATPGSLAGEFVGKLFEDDRGRIWIGTLEHGAAVLDPAGDPAARPLRRLPPRPADPRGLSHFWVYGIAQAGRREIWIATFGGGIDVVDPESLAVVERLRHDPAIDSTLPGDRVGALLRDRAGLLWAGTWGEGMARHDPAVRAVQALRYSPSRPAGLTHPEAVRALPRRDGTLWVGTNGNGVDVLDAGLVRIGGFRPAPRDPGALSDGSVTCLAEGPDGSAWVATLDGNLHRLRPGARRFERLTVAGGLPGGPIRALTFAPDGALWAGAAEGLARIDTATDRIAVFRHRPDDPTSLSSSTVEAIAVDRAGTLWVGTGNGLDAVDWATGRAVSILAAPERADALPNGWVPDLLVAQDGRLWVGTQGGACLLTAWDGRRARFLRVADAIGRPPAPAESLVEDARGWIWIGPRLAVLPAAGSRGWRSRELGPADGVDFRSFFIASRARRGDGALLFGSPEGLLVVRPAELAPWTYAPPVVATALRVGGVERPGAARLARLVLPPREHGFRLDVAALDLTAPAALAYRYRLEGFDRGWVAADAAHASVAYTNLDPGGYLLRVQATNRAGRWSERELRLPVEVEPAFYQTAWFRAALLLASAALAYGAYRLRVRRLEARGRELERVVAERTGELAAAYRRIEEASLTDPLTGLRNRRFLEQSIPADVELAARRHEEMELAAARSAVQDQTSSAVQDQTRSAAQDQARSAPLSPTRGASAGAGSEHTAGRAEARGRGAEPDTAPGAGPDLVFLLLDLDHFKSVNDTHGHAAGDAVLVETAEVLRGILRAADHLVRWGGEEFLAVARFVDRREAATIAEKIRAALAAHPFRLPDGTVLFRTASIGYAVYPWLPARPRAVGWEEVVDLADHGLYTAKRGGRNAWVGVEASEAAQDPEATLRRFRADPEAALAGGEMRRVGMASSGAPS